MKYTEIVYYVLVMSVALIGLRALLAIFFFIPGSENVTARIIILVAIFIALLYVAYRVILWSLN